MNLPLEVGSPRPPNTDLRLGLSQVNLPTWEGPFCKPLPLEMLRPRSAMTGERARALRHGVDAKTRLAAVMPAALGAGVRKRLRGGGDGARQSQRRLL